MAQKDVAALSVQSQEIKTETLEGANTAVRVGQLLQDLTDSQMNLTDDGSTYDQSAGVSTNAANIGTNATNIGTNATDISTNAGLISTNTTNIGNNTSAIALKVSTDVGLTEDKTFPSNTARWFNTLTQAEYDGITPDADELYFIV